MRWRFTCCLFFCFFSLSVSAQKLSGQWTGGFLSNGDPFGGHEYVLELEVDGDEVGGYSYTYFLIMGKRYYVICKLKGSYDKASKSIVVTETEKVKANTPPDFRDCLQTHMLTYLKNGADESLQGSWIPAPGQGNCGKGETTLKRKALVRVAPAPATEPVASNKTATAPKTGSTTKPPTTTKPSSGTAAKTGTTAKPATGATAKSGTTTKPSTGATTRSGTSAKPAAPPVAKTTQPAKPKPLGSPQSGGTREKPSPAPGKTTTEKVLEKPVTVEKTNRTGSQPMAPGTISTTDMTKLEKRTKQVIKMIDVSESTFKVDLYDNGQIDGDTVSLYYNGKLMVSRKRLSTTPISLTIKLDPDKADNDLVMYAENLGSIPPNTALMVVTVGDKRYEVNITSTEQTSGTVRFRMRE
jgi:hypothetical protein